MGEEKYVDLPLNSFSGVGSTMTQTSAPNTSGPNYLVSLPGSTIRRMAKLSPEADRKLRDQVPEAFSEVVIWRQTGGLFPRRIESSDGVLLDVASLGPYTGRGLYLSGRYQWEIIKNPSGIGSVLVARRSL